jgi:hypothetical protein
VDFSRFTALYWQFPKRASTSRTSGLRFGRVGIIGWPLQKSYFPLLASPVKTRFYNMLEKKGQSRKVLRNAFGVSTLLQSRSSMFSERRASSQAGMSRNSKDSAKIPVVMQFQGIP